MRLNRIFLRGFYLVIGLAVAFRSNAKPPINSDSLFVGTEIRKTIKLEDATLSYVVRPGNGPAMILIPGSFEDVNQWNEVVPLLGENLNLILVEVRGHGESWPPPKDGTIEQLAKDVMAVVDNEKLEEFYVGGHSIGGMISKEVGRSWPQRVKGVISIEGWTYWKASKDAFNGDTKSTLTSEQERKRLEAREMATGQWTDEQKMDFGSIWRKWEKGQEFMDNTNLPVIELYGDRGKEKPTLDQLYIPDRPNIEVYWIKNASHNLTLEEPNEVAIVIMQFIERIESQKE